ncbi:DUF4235 domain-containing protein [Xylanimonas sp. McL0601]|uniref:DUF4235 domain-containing protein n=1 Tax=Xylanimonas sp. McL0601 TaxID=3414739 RepID=UPI003CFAF41D
MVLTLAAGWLAQRAVVMIWQKSTGHAAPRDLDDDQITVIQAVGFAALSAGAAVLARRMTYKGTNRAIDHFVAKDRFAEES